MRQRDLRHRFRHGNLAAVDCFATGNIPKKMQHDAILKRKHMLQKFNQSMIGMAFGISTSADIGIAKKTPLPKK